MVLPTGSPPSAHLQAPDEGTAVAVKEGRLPRKLAARQKVLRSAAILAAAHGATPVARPPPRKPKGSGQSQPAAPQQPAQQQQRAAGGRVQRQGRTVDPAELAIWEPEVEQQGGGWVPQAKRAPKRHKRGGAAPAALVPAAAAAAGIRPHIPAVEIDPAGRFRGVDHSHLRRWFSHMSGHCSDEQVRGLQQRGRRREVEPCCAGAQPTEPPAPAAPACRLLVQPRCRAAPGGGGGGGGGRDPQAA